MSKGSKQRPYDASAYGANYDAIFPRTIEDETFNALRRQPFEQVVSDYAGRGVDYFCVSFLLARINEGKFDMQEVNDLESRGWSLKDLVNYIHERYESADQCIRLNSGLDIPVWRKKR